MNSFIELYAYMLDNKIIKDRIIEFKRNEFIHQEESILIAIGIIDNIINQSTKINKVILFDEYLNKKFNQMYFIKDYMLNKYGEINGYLVYDFFYLEYDLILNKIKKILAR